MQSALGQSCERCVSRRKNGEWSFPLQGIDEISSLYGRDQSLEVRIADSDVDNILCGSGLRAELKQANSGDCEKTFCDHLETIVFLITAFAHLVHRDQGSLRSRSKHGSHRVHDASRPTFVSSG